MRVAIFGKNGNVIDEVTETYEWHRFVMSDAMRGHNHMESFGFGRLVL
jgi:hypothetical protein